MTKIVTLYNHKGGVSKTTTTFNLAHALAERGAKVLLVDGDPQCNLTELALARTIEELDEEVEESGEPTELPGTTVLDALAPRLNGDRPDVDVDAIDLIQPDSGTEVFLFRGDISLSEAEDNLAYAHSQRLTNEVHYQRNYIAIFDMLQRLAAREEFDYVLVDVGPSAGALTRSFFLACDLFLVPTAPDRFNYQAVGSLSAIIGKWIREHSMVVADYRDLGLNVPDGKPRFAGLIVQRFQRYAGAPKRGFQVWMDRIPARAREQLLPALTAAVGDESAVERDCWEEPTAAEIPEFSSLAPMMLTHGRPVWQLTAEETGWVGVVWDNRRHEMDRLRDLFVSLAERVERA